MFNNYRYLENMFFAKSRCENAIIKHCIELMDGLKCNRKYQSLLRERKNIQNELKDFKKRSDRSKYLARLADISRQLNDIRKDIGLTKVGLQTWSKVIGKKYSNYLSSQMMQAISHDVYAGVEKIIFGDGKKLHYKGIDYITSVSATSIVNGLKFKQIKDGRKIIKIDYNTVICPNGVELPFEIDKNDEYEVEGFKPDKVKFIRIVRKMFFNGWHYYVQFVIDDKALKKIERGKGNCGMDIGVSTVAAVTDNKCILECLNPDKDKYNNKIKNTNRSLERKNKINNPDCYSENGTIKKGSKLIKSKNAKKTKRKLRTLCRKKHDNMKQTQCKIANMIISSCDKIYLEENDYKAMAKRAKKGGKSDRTVDIKNKDGIVRTIHKNKRRKRFGKIVGDNAPAQFENILKLKCVLYDIEFIYIDTNNFKASQYNHQTDKYVKKKLSERWNKLTSNGEDIKIQRDLYSAFLIKNSDSSLEHTDVVKCNGEFERFIENHNSCIEEIRNNVKARPSSFGF